MLSAHCLSAYQQLHSLQILKKNKNKKNYLKANVLQYVATQSNQTCPVCTSINIPSHKFMMYPCICTSHTTWYHASIATLSSLSEAILFGTCLCVVPLLWQQQTTQLPKLNSHNEACLFICQSFQPELLEDGEQQVPLAFFNIVP